MAARSLLPAFILALSAACWAPVARGAEDPPRAKEPPGAGAIQRQLLPVPLPIPNAIRPVTPVTPVASVRWDELLDLKLVAGRIEVRTPEPPASIAGYLRNGRSITIQIEGTPAPSLWTINALRRNLAGGRLEWMARCAPSDAAAAQNQLTGSLRPVSVVIISGRLMITGRGQVDEKSVSVQYREDARGCQLVVLDGRNRVAGGAVGAGLAFGARAPNANARVALTDNSVGHMRSAHPAEVRTYLQPLLDRIAGRKLLRPGDADIFAAFTSLPADPHVAAEVDEIVEALDAPACPDRQAASARLEEMGRPAVLAACRLDRAQLSYEQRIRVENFLARHSLGLDPAAACTDYIFLCDCLEDEDREIRAAALEALRSAAGKPIPFDLDSTVEDRAAAAARILDSLTPAPTTAP